MSIRIAISIVALTLLPLAGPTSAQAEDSADDANDDEAEAFLQGRNIKGRRANM